MHGGNVYEYINKYGKAPLDFSASVSHFPASEEIRAAAAGALEQMERYPDPECGELRTAIAEHFGTTVADHPCTDTEFCPEVAISDILCGAGASDLIYRYVCATRPKKALIITPAFSEYESALNLYGCQVVSHPLKEERDFALDTSIIDDIDDELELLILNLPHNPTGLVPDKEILYAIIKRCTECNVGILSDECFIDFLDDSWEHTLIGRPKVTVIRAFTKYYGLTDLRLGYAISDDHELIEKMKSAGPPWAVSSIAQAAGIQALKECRDIRDEIKRERSFLYDALTDLGMQVIQGLANFLLFYSDDPTLYEKLYDRGILIRDCSDFAELKKGWYRIAVRTHSDNLKLVTSLSS